MLGAKIPAGSAADFGIQAPVDERSKAIALDHVKSDTLQKNFFVNDKSNLSLSGQKSLPLVLFQEIATALELPRDSLSVVLIAFARFFSLTPSSALIGSLRRELLSLQKSSPDSAGQKSALEAEAMAAVIAADKGVTLSPQTLERYARFLLPPMPPAENVDAEENPQHWNENPKAEELQKMMEEQAKKDCVLGILNSLPGKNRHYWVVLPFTVNIKGVELRIFIRVLKGETLADGNEYLVVDISSNKRQWRCFLKKTGINLTANIRVFPECSPRTLDLIKKNAEKFLGGMLVNLQNSDKIPSWVEDLFSEPYPTVNEEV